MLRNILVAGIAALLVGCIDLADGSGGYYGSRDPYYGRRDDYYQSDWERERERRRIHREHERLEDTRDRIHEERERLDRERRDAQRAREEAERRRREERCPPGYSQSERKCSSEERRHGCKDVRLSNGLGCVRR